MKLWYRGKEILIKKVFDLTHKENIEKNKEALRKPVGLSFPLWILWNCLLQNIPLRGHNDIAGNDAELAESDLTNFGNLVELLWHRVEGGNRNLENHVQNGPWMPHVLLLQFRFLFVCFCGISR